jgi:DNA-binding Xre family transcriptional regulator
MPTSPPTRCPRGDCPHTLPCPVHTPAPWAGSTRRATLPKDWDKRRAVVLRRDPHCTCPGCKRCHPLNATYADAGCRRCSTDCDHIGDRHDHSLGNLRGLCHPCHTQHTHQQSDATKAVRALRLQHRLTLGDLAARLTRLDHPMSLNAVSKMEIGTRRITVDDLVALAAALDVTPHDLLHFERAESFT